MIYIEQPKAPLIIWAVLKDIRKAKIEFTPDIMLTLLKCTNHPTSIRDLLKEIPSGKEADFKEAILGMVDRRKHTDTNLETMRNIANIGGFSEEFENIHAKDKWIKPHYDVSVFVAKSQNDLTNNKDLSGYVKLECHDVGSNNFATPGYLFYIDKNMMLPAVCEFNVRSVYFDGADLSNVKEFLFDNLLNLKFDSVIGLNENINTECGNSLEIINTDIPFESFYSEKCSFLELESIKKMPKNLIISNKYSVSFNQLSMKNVEKLQLTNCKNVKFNNCVEFRAEMNFTDVENFYFNNCGMQNCEELKLEGQYAAFVRGCSLPPVLDVSRVKYVNIKDCSLYNVKKLVVKNRYQLPEYHKLEELQGMGIEVQITDEDNSATGKIHDKIRSILRDKFK